MQQNHSNQNTWKAYEIKRKALQTDTMPDHIKQLATRKKTEENHNTKVHKCKNCSYKTKYSTILQRHIESIHYKLRSECNYCGKDFSTWDNLNRHMKNKHTNPDKTNMLHEPKS